MKTLTSNQVQEFVEQGYTVVREAFPRTLAPAFLDAFWLETPFNPEDRSTWVKSRDIIKRSFSEGSFAGIWSEKALGALDDLLGEGRYHQPQGSGWVLFNLPGFAQAPWKPPENGWHVDGIHFHHHVDSREQGLIGLFLFTDVEPGGGATVLRPGSHRVTARILQDAEPDGLDLKELCRRVQQQVSDFPVAQVPGKAGDLLLMHPHIFHASSDNCSDHIRVASNMCVSLKEKMNLSPEGRPHSPVERAIIEALGNP